MSCTVPKETRPAATDTCRVCAPLGAVLAFRGLAGCMPLIHGSQGCATYIRRYLISHFREPVDVGSTSFSESSTIFGGESNLEQALHNLTRQYQPDVVGLCTTCLAETIGEDTTGILARIHRNNPTLPPVVAVSTPSFKGCQYRGFHDTVSGLLRWGAVPGAKGRQIALLPGPLSPADLRHLRELIESCEVPAVLFPDYSDTLDGPSLSTYDPIPAGGATRADLAATGSAACAIQLGATLGTGPAGVLEEHGVSVTRLGVPIGVRATDAFIDAVIAAGGREPSNRTAERGRLVDAYVDGHKYVSGKRALVAGDPDLVAALCGFCAEIGIVPIIAASGAASGRLATAINNPLTTVIEDADWERIANTTAERMKPDLILGPSKAYPLARRIGVPLVRVGFPVHDRIGAGRILHVGYRGTQRLFDDVVNTLLAHNQAASPVGFAYM